MKQRDKCAKGLRNKKQKYFNNLKFESITDTKKFWNTMKPLFSNKGKAANLSILHKSNRIIKDK